MVEGVEEISPQRQLMILPRQREVLGDSDINVLHTVGKEGVPAERRRVEVCGRRRTESLTRQQHR
jgi:hypothetical protein